MLNSDILKLFVQCTSLFEKIVKHLNLVNIQWLGYIFPLFLTITAVYAHIYSTVYQFWIIRINTGQYQRKGGAGGRVGEGEVARRASGDV